MPTFMRQASGGRSSGGGSRSKDRRGPPSMGGSKPQKIIQIPQYEKMELKKSDNAWVRPKEKLKELSDDDREKDVSIMVFHSCIVIVLSKRVYFL